MTASQLAAGPFEVRRANFGDVIEFYAPGLKRWQSSEWTPTSPRRFLPVSVTGSRCALSCEHCKTKMLSAMIPLQAGRGLFELAKALNSNGTEGLLVSGGSTRTGAVPLAHQIHDIARVRSELGMKVVVHCGLVSPRLASALASTGVDGVMMDVVGADETLRDVYHLDLTVADVERSLQLLVAEGLRVVPHVVIGLHFGRLLGERRALEMLTRHQVAAIVLVVLSPLAGTPMAGLDTPPVAEVAELFASARLVLPTTPLNLGCARPGGAVKHLLDQAAVDSGLNGIAFPADGTISYARSRGLSPRLFEDCCSLAYEAEACPSGQLTEVTR